MPKYVKSADSMIKVKTPEGEEIEVTERAFNVIYETQGYQRLGTAEVTNVNEESPGEKKPAEIEPVEPTEGNEPDYFGFEREKLIEVKNDDLKAFLEREGIEYKSSATKEDLVDLILGE